MRIVFMGSSEFALEALIKIVESGFNVVSVYTKIPKPKGRGHHLEKTSVHVYAEEKSLVVETPKTLRSEESFEKLKSYKPDVIIVAAYGLILPSNVLDLPEYGCINIHGSLLPRWRGAAPIERAIMAGDEITGITIMRMDEGIDTGDMILKRELSIGEQENFVSLMDRMKTLGAEMIIEVLDDIKKITYIKQTEEGATYADKIQTKDYVLSPEDSMKVNYNKIRALGGCKFFYSEKDFFIIHEALMSDKITGDKMLLVENGQLYLPCCDGFLMVQKIQRPSKKVLPVSEFLKGFR